MDWVDWTVPLPGLVFLFTVLDPLPGRWRERMSGVVTWLWLAILLLALFASGARFGLFAALLASFVLGCLMQPLGEGLARRLYPRNASTPGPWQEEATRQSWLQPEERARA